uniref:Uncharacterized protein n=1 Tax=Caenorhabditis japonica TaxID=281687 RepID=A0A8R1IBJ3_CAEJA
MVRIRHLVSLHRRVIRVSIPDPATRKRERGEREKKEAESAAAEEEEKQRKELEAEMERKKAEELELAAKKAAEAAVNSVAQNSWIGAALLVILFRNF